MLYKEAIRAGIEKILDTREDSICVGQDITDNVGHHGTTLGLREKYGTSRIFSTPLSEDAISGFANGFALSKSPVIVNHIRSDFLALCVNQIVNVGAKLRYLNPHTPPLPIFVRSSIGRSWGQGCQHSQAGYNIFYGVPGIDIHVPVTNDQISDAYTLEGCGNLRLIFEHRLLYDLCIDPLETKNGFSVHNTGKAATIVCLSAAILDGMKAVRICRELLNEEVQLIAVSNLTGIDSNELSSTFESSRVVFVENSWVKGGFFAGLALELLKVDKRREFDILGYEESSCPTRPDYEFNYYPNFVKITAAIINRDSTFGDGRLIDEIDRIAKIWGFYDSRFKGPF